jgi:hypothetical protein
VLARAGLLLAGVFEFRVDVSKRIRSKVRSENCKKKQRVQAEAGRKRQISGFWAHTSTLLVVEVRTYHCILPSLKQQRSFWQQTAAAEGTPFFTLAADSNNGSALESRVWNRPTAMALNPLQGGSRYLLFVGSASLPRGESFILNLRGSASRN